MNYKTISFSNASWLSCDSHTILQLLCEHFSESYLSDTWVFIQSNWRVTEEWCRKSYTFYSCVSQFVCWAYILNHVWTYSLLQELQVCPEECLYWNEAHWQTMFNTFVCFVATLVWECCLCGRVCLLEGQKASPPEGSLECGYTWTVTWELLRGLLERCIVTECLALLQAEMFFRHVTKSTTWENILRIVD